MEIDFEDESLRRLFTDPEFRNPRLGADVVRQFRKKVNFLVAASDERDLYGYRALRFEKLAGSRKGQHSIRLNDQWRLILRLEHREQGQVIVIVEIVDYH